LTLRLKTEGSRTEVQQVRNLPPMDVDQILRSEAFGLVSTYSPDTQEKLDKYQRLRAKGRRRTAAEEEELGQLSLFIGQAYPYGGPPEEGSLEARIEEFLEKTI
jgi:hypothetical protein